MKKILTILPAVLALSACAHNDTHQEIAIGGATDAHGCLISAGQSYSFLKQQCVQVFNVAEIKLADPKNDTLAIYGILSDDKTQVEIFGADFAENTIFDAVKGGYVSKDGKTRLVKHQNGWKLRTQWRI